jgi:uncharacterized protein YecE (DUF72 family)
MELRIGTCGWSFKDWKGTFYPPGTRDELVFYAGEFDAVEIDSTWHHAPAARTVESWQRRAPEGFIFCPKLPGEITHENLLRDSDALVSNFLSNISLLEDKLGPILVQLAPKLKYEDFATLESFLGSLSTDFRYAVEFRHRSWLEKPDALSLLSDHNMAVTMAHHPWYPRIEEVTTDFTFIRLLGRRDVFPDFAETHRRRDDDLQQWADLLLSLERVVPRGFAFINNQFEGHSPNSVRRLQGLVGISSAGSGAPQQGRLLLE